MQPPAQDSVTFSQADDVSALLQALRARIAQAADPERAPHMQAYMRSAMPFHGVAATPLRGICREVIETHRLSDRAAWERAVLTLWDQAAYREERYAALAVAGHRFYRAFQDADTLDVYRHLITSGAWWDLVDGLATHQVGAILRADPARVTPLIRQWARSQDLWLRRSAILAQVGSKGATDTELLTDVLVANLEGTLHGREFFIRKAVGWALRAYSSTDPAWVVSFVEEHAAELSGLSRREALRHVDATR